MGMSADAILIWGVLVKPFDADQPTQFWDEPAESWHNFKGGLEVASYGDFTGYADDEALSGVLTLARVPRYRGDCWEAQAVELNDLITASSAYQVCAEAQALADKAGLTVDFAADAGWWLVASYG